MPPSRIDPALRKRRLALKARMSNPHRRKMLRQRKAAERGRSEPAVVLLVEELLRHGITVDSTSPNHVEGIRRAVVAVQRSCLYAVVASLRAQRNALFEPIATFLDDFVIDAETHEEYELRMAEAERARAKLRPA